MAIRHPDSARKFVSEADVMSNRHQRQVHLPLELEENLLNLEAIFRIKITRWLVREQNLRPLKKCPRNRHPLLLAARKLGRIMFQPVRHAEKIEQLAGARATSRQRQALRSAPASSRFRAQ